MNDVEIGKVKKVNNFVGIKKIYSNLFNKDYFGIFLIPVRSLRSISLKRFLFIMIVTFFSFVGVHTVYEKYQAEIDDFIIFAKSVNFSDISVDNKFSSAELTTDLSSDSKVKGASVAKTVSNYKTMDKRAYILDEYFRVNKSPLYGTGEIFVRACDRFKAPSDCLVVAAIAKHETNLCKYYVSADQYNCWGFGGPPGYRYNWKGFSNSINYVTDILANYYGYEYMVDPSLMEGTFCGQSKGCIGWGNRIKYFMRQIDDFGVSIGVGRMSDWR